MKFFRSERSMVWIVLFAVLCTTSGSRVFGADDEGKSSNSTTRAAGKPESPPPPLTERERELLDRMMELEKRVAELEAKQPKQATELAASPGAPSNSMPASVEVSPLGTSHDVAP